MDMVRAFAHFGREVREADALTSHVLAPFLNWDNRYSNLKLDIGISLSRSCGQVLVLFPKHFFLLQQCYFSEGQFGERFEAGCRTESFCENRPNCCSKDRCNNAAFDRGACMQESLLSLFGERMENLARPCQ